MDGWRSSEAERQATVRQGSEYERFVYEKFCGFFANSVVTLNDRIAGRQSGLEREIDISIKTDFDGKEILYIVQCKDRGKRPADIVILGEFSSVIKDVGAAKGFLICTSGFAKSNYRYAQSIGIELLTVEDIKSTRWRADIQIPLIYIKKNLKYILNGVVIVNVALAIKKNINPAMRINLSIDSLITFDNGNTSTTIKEYVQAWLTRAGAFLKDVVDIDLTKPNLGLQLEGVWVKCKELHINLAIERKYYLKYLTPDEYSQVRDHRRNAAVPLKISVAGPCQLDDTFVEVPTSDIPVTPILSARLEEWTDLERAQGKVPAIEPRMNGEPQREGFIPFNFEFPAPAFCSVPVSTGSDLDTNNQ